MVKFQRILNMVLPKRQSAFLWGARKTGKSTFLKENFPDSIVYDLLNTDLYFDLSKNPALLREQLLAKEEHQLKYPVIIDEIQKVPMLLDEVHWLIENKGIQFILCGSSARKLKRGKANLLGGRAWRFEMFPLTTPELKKIDLLKILNRGLVPLHYLQDNYKKSLKSYIYDYMKEEVFAEGLVRNIPAFSRFFDSMGYSQGEMVNYSNIARDCGVDYKTVKEHYQILIDTLMGRFIEPFKKKKNRQIITKMPKFYLFDVGVAGYLTKRNITVEKGRLFGKAFEHFILMEMLAYSSYNEIDFTIDYWRTKSGLEVDFILGGGEVAVEVKGTNRVDKRDFKALNVFIDEYSPAKVFIVCNEKKRRLHGKTIVSPYQEFLQDLWAGKII